LKTKSYTWILLAAFCSAAQAPAPRVQHKLVYSKDGTFGYRDTPTQPWSGYRVDDPDRPKPKTVDPGTFSTQEPALESRHGKLKLLCGEDRWLPFSCGSKRFHQIGFAAVQAVEPELPFRERRDGADQRIAGSPARHEIDRGYSPAEAQDRVTRICGVAIHYSGNGP
jgi:hypothetical protein